MIVSIATVFPSLYENFLNTSLVKRSQQNEIVTFDVAGFSDFCKPKERIDAPAVGHGAGMVIRPDVVERVVNGLEAKHGNAYKIVLTPQGKKLDQNLVKQLSKTFTEQKHVMLLTSRYEGIDARAQKQYADIEISIGDYILMGGDIPAMVLLEAVLRYIPGVIGKKESVDSDSFSTPFLDYDCYTTPPRSWNGAEVPEILLSGNHKAIADYRKANAVKMTIGKNFNWVRSQCKKIEDKTAVKNALPSHYIALMHDDVIIQKDKIGTSSVTSLDIHDIARSAKTYGIKEYFLVTPLEDQKRIVGKILDFWNTSGIEYNQKRHEAVKLVKLKDSLDQVIKSITQKEGVAPLIIATSAQTTGHDKLISYKQQEKVWACKRPVLFIFGTAQGLAEHVVKKSDFLLLPIQGFTDFNHLSVRSAVAIILDRWLGINLD